MTGQVCSAVIAAVASLGVSACCVLPMVFILLGLGGSWLAVFGKIAAMDEVREQVFRAQAGSIVGGTADQFAAHIRRG